VVAISDGVTAIAVTLLVLEVHPPEDTRHLLPAFIPYYWLPIAGEAAKARRRRRRG
jgi:uncharacterized membrane protein